MMCLAERPIAVAPCRASCRCHCLILSDVGMRRVYNIPCLYEVVFELLVYNVIGGLVKMKQYRTFTPR